MMLIWLFVGLSAQLWLTTNSADLSNAVKIPISEKTREKIMQQWYMDATGGLMLGVTNQMYKRASPSNRKRLGRCTAKATSVGKYARCMDQLATALEKRGGLAKTPIPANKKFKPISGGKNARDFMRRMVGGVRSKDIPGMDEAIEKHNSKLAEKQEEDAQINSVVNSALGSIPGVSDISNTKVLSPTILSSQNSGPNSVLSPDVLSINKGPNSILSLQDAGLGPAEREFLAQSQQDLASLKEMRKDKDLKRRAKDYIKANNIPEEEDFVKFYGSKTKAAFKAYDDLEKSMSVEQARELAQKGYTWMTQAQANKFYRAIREPPPNVKELSRMSEDDRDKALVQMLKEYEGANDFRVQVKDLKGTPIVKVSRRSASGRRRKRAPSVLEPKTFAPSVLKPSTMGGSILSPSIFNPSVLSPSTLGVSILSPSVSGPTILSPRVLRAGILSPQAFTASVLSPTVLNPSILSPVAIGATILSPSVLSPSILSPAAISAKVLSPCVLSPSVDSPKLLSSTVLSPGVLC